MEISRAFTRWDEYLAEQFHITEHEWRSYADKNKNLIHYDVYRNDSTGFPYYFIVIDNKKELNCKLSLRGGRILITYDQIKDDLLIELDKIALALNAMLLIDNDLEYPRSKVFAAQRRLAKRGKIPEIAYQKESFGVNNMWLSIRSDMKFVMNYFKLSGEKKSWQDGLDVMYKSECIFIFYYNGWTFLAGPKVESLFNSNYFGGNSFDQKYINHMIEWGKTFCDVQLYLHYDRSENLNAFYRVLNGKLFYGEFHSEEYSKKHGRLPKNLKHLTEVEAIAAASEWSFDPDFLRFQKETVEDGVLIAMIPIKF